MDQPTDQPTFPIEVLRKAVRGSVDTLLLLLRQRNGDRPLRPEAKASFEAMVAAVEAGDPEIRAMLVELGIAHVRLTALAPQEKKAN
ncbi:MAG: hypothetical protein HY898_22855 [Deltaproteobacteria bacterium]|nr:hypothetical protein [Deltaproteobacteria bacterium]